MRPNFVRLSFAALALCAGASLSSCDDKNGSGGSQSQGGGSSDLSWSVGYEKDKLNPQLEATATHTIDGGGEVDMKATCDSDTDGSAITLNLEYHAKDASTNNDANSSYATVGSGAFERVSIPYQIDGGEIQTASSQTDYRNSANVVFAYINPNGKTDAGGMIAEMTGKMFGGIQDLQPFLHAHDVRFQLPLGDGTTEIVAVNPQDSDFQSFVSQCKIDIKSIDAAVAQQQADEKAAADAKAQADADAAKAQQALQDAAAQAAQAGADAVKQACATGQGTLRMTGAATNLEGAQAGITTVYVFSGQVVQPVADPDAVADGKCSVEFTRDGSDLTGKLPLSSLLFLQPPPDAQPAQAPQAAN